MVVGAAVEQMVVMHSRSLSAAGLQPGVLVKNEVQGLELVVLGGAVMMGPPGLMERLVVVVVEA